MYQVYTGEGKGKTTAALGLGLRALGAGKSVHLMQFIKSMDYSEIKTIENLDGFSYEILGQGCLLGREASQEDKDLAREGLEKAGRYLDEEAYDILILDELHIAIYLGLVELSQALEIIDRMKTTEVISTGRYAPKELIERADLVTEMREIKHYYQKGQENRPGIDF